MSKQKIEKDIATLEELLKMPDVEEKDKEKTRNAIAKLKEQIKELEAKGEGKSAKPAKEAAKPAKRKHKHKAEGEHAEHKPAGKRGRPKGEKKKHKTKPAAAKPEVKKVHKKHKATHKVMTPKRKAMLEKREKKKVEKKAAKKHVHTPHKPAAELTLDHRIDRIASDVKALKPEIDKLEGKVRKETEEKIREKVAKMLAHTFEHGGHVPGGRTLLQKIIYGSGKKLAKGGGVEMHPHMSIPTGKRPEHGYEVTKAAPVHKKVNFSKGDMKLDTGYRSVHGRQLTKGKKGKQYKAGGGLDAKVTPNSALAAIVGSEPTTRPEITKKLWAYIKDHKLQNPDKRRIIMSDATFKAFTGEDSFDMFKLAKFVSANIK